MPRHIIIDNSNTYSMLSHAKQRLEPDVSWAAMRVELDNFFDVLENQQPVITRAFVGSEKETAEPVWQKALDRGYDIYVLRRIANQDGSTSEQAVDEIAHLIIANAILDHSSPQTLVIVSGDGNMSDFGTSFVGQAERALKHGWDVEIWAWFDGLTSRYEQLKNAYPGRVSTKYLDCLYFEVTFVRSGTFHHRDGSPAPGAPRKASPISWPLHISN